MAKKKSNDKSASKKDPGLKLKPAYWFALAAVVILVLIVILALNKPEAKAPETPMGSQETCGDSVCGAKELSSGSCPVDCIVEQAPPIEAPVEEVAGCKKEGETIPVIPNPPVCCSGLELIAPKQASVLGISGICTAKCGNGACDLATESPKNCPADCQAILDAQPICDGAGTSKEGWYQNDKILKYEYCEGCVAECRNKGTMSEGWYNSCDNKQIKTRCI